MVWFEVAGSQEVSFVQGAFPGMSRMVFGLRDGGQRDKDTESHCLRAEQILQACSECRRGYLYVRITAKGTPQRTEGLATVAHVSRAPALIYCSL